MDNALLTELLKQYGLITVGVALVGLFILTALFNLATFYFNQRIQGTHEEKLEHIKANIEKELSEFKAVQLKVAENVQDAKWKLKYEACLKAMEIVDAFLSHRIKEVKGKTPVRQPADTIKARECYTGLVLTCQKPEVAEAFIKAMFPAEKADDRQLTDNLNGLRNAVRKELGFGEDIRLSTDTAWFVRLAGDNSGEAQEPVSKHGPDK